MAFWGEIPGWVGRDRKRVRRYVERELQMPLPGVCHRSNVLQFPAPAPKSTTVHRDAKGRKVPAHVWYQQPRAFLPRNSPLADTRDPNWRVAYAQNWMARRKAAGLPHEITQPLYVAALALHSLQQRKSA